MRKHTQGPWVVDIIEDVEKFNLPRGPIHQVLASVPAFGGSKKYPSTVCTIEEYQEVDMPIDRLADATLITAAPDLLKTLQDIAEQLEAHPAYINGATQEDMEEQGGEAADITWMAMLARAAIAKAVLP
jgi:hypothetical protein